MRRKRVFLRVCAYGESAIHVAGRRFLGDQYGHHVTGLLPAGPVGNPSPDPSSLPNSRRLRQTSAQRMWFGSPEKIVDFLGVFGKLILVYILLVPVPANVARTYHLGLVSCTGEFFGRSLVVSRNIAAAHNSVSRRGQVNCHGNRTHRSVFHRRLTCEVLEDRRLLSIDAMQIGAFNTSPALFVANEGQWADASVRFMHQGNGANVALTDTGAAFQILKREDATDLDEAQFRGWLSESPEAQVDVGDNATEALQFSASFVGANRVAPVGLERAEAMFSYFVGDRSDWRANVLSYGSAAYENLYAGIDLVAWGQSSHLKYEFHVAPGADYRQIRIHYAGIDGLSLAADGSLNVDLGDDWGALTDNAPFIYQIIDGEQVGVTGRFELLDSLTYTFLITGSYDPSRELVIDPDLAWATYLGGTSYEYGYGIATDAAGNAFVAGETASADFVGATNTYEGGARDAYLANISDAGVLQWVTYLGGSGWDKCLGVAVDGAGDAYVVGETASTDFSGVNNTYIGGSRDAFVAKVSTAGVLQWATYVGGNYVDYGYGISVDSSGNALIAGATASTVLSEATNTYLGGSYDAYMAQVSATGVLQWATYIGGSGDEYGLSISMDDAGSGYLTGWTKSTDLSGANNNYNGGSYDAFAVKVSTAGALQWATYLGGSGDDYGEGISLDASGNVYTTGSTNSTNLANATNTNNGSTDAFVAKVSAAGILQWSTYLGGTGNDYGGAIVANAGGNSYLAGRTTSTDFSGADNDYGGGYLDGFVAKVSATGAPQWATYVGGSDWDRCYSISLDDFGNILLTGETGSTDLSGANNSYEGGTRDAFVAKLILNENQAPTDIALSNSSVHENQASGATVGAFSTTDPNAGDTFAYTLVAGTGGEDNASFDISGSTLLTAAIFDYETKNSYSIRVRSTDQGDLWCEKVFTITVTDVLEEVTGRYVFYNNSTWDGNDAAANEEDDGAIASDKVALLPSQGTTLDNYTNYDGGVNGIMIDIAGLYDQKPIADDFELRFGNTTDPANWAIVTSLATVAEPRIITGPEGTRRVEITWTDGTLINGWLQVTVKAGSSTGLVSPDVFYFGNLPGDAGDTPDSAVVDVLDEQLARSNRTYFTLVDITNAYDFNRDRKVNAADEYIARTNAGAALLFPFTAPGLLAQSAMADTVVVTPPTKVSADTTMVAPFAVAMGVTTAPLARISTSTALVRFAELARPDSTMLLRAVDRMYAAYDLFELGNGKAALSAHQGWGNFLTESLRPHDLFHRQWGDDDGSD